MPPRVFAASPVCRTLFHRRAPSSPCRRPAIAAVGFVAAAPDERHRARAGADRRRRRRASSAA